METKDITISAKGKKLGRLASEVAVILRGKNKSSFERNILPNVKVKITEASMISIDEKKLPHIEHKKYSGYPGGLKISSGKLVLEKKGKTELLRHAINGMLPKNKSRSKIMRNLTITE